MRLLFLSIFILFNTFLHGQENRNWSKWETDTLTSETGVIRVIKTRHIANKRKSGFKTDCITLDYNLCRQLTSRSTVLTETCFRPRVLKSKTKEYKTNCSEISDLSHFNYIHSDSINYTWTDSILTVQSGKKNQTKFIFKDEFNQELFSQPIERGTNIISIAIFKWPGLYIIEFTDNSTLIARDKKIRQ
jgi:hypothetical protein